MLKSQCPKCGATQPFATDVCHACGVVFARQAAPPDVRLAPVPESAAVVGACRTCHGSGPVADATFRQNIGALFMRFERRVQGPMCRSCLSRNFWSYTIITTLVGWLGVVSVIVAPIYVILNVTSFARASATMRRLRAGAGAAAAA